VAWRGRRHRFIERFFLAELKSLKTRTITKIKDSRRTSRREIICLSLSLFLSISDIEKWGHLRVAASCSQFRNCFFIVIFREPTELLYYRAFGLLPIFRATYAARRASLRGPHLVTAFIVSRARGTHLAILANSSARFLPVAFIFMIYPSPLATRSSNREAPTSRIPTANDGFNALAVPIKLNCPFPYAWNSRNFLVKSLGTSKHNLSMRRKYIDASKERE